MTSLCIVDAFADRPFAGNPAGVCILEGQAPEDWMQLVARELNQSETAFLYPEADAYHLRWFTPKVEVELCGHATLASAHLLWERGLLGANQMARFSTLSGMLTAQRDGDLIELDFPAFDVAPEDPPSGLLEALGLADSSVFVARRGTYYLVHLGSGDAVRSLAPDFSALDSLKAAVLATALSERESEDFVSRFFAPSIGVPEDPVTGFAHCMLGPYWAGILGREDLVGYQASARGGHVRVRVRGDRVLLGGRAVTVLEGNILGPK